jgi:hypothetical protein
MDHIKHQEHCYYSIMTVPTALIAQGAEEQSELIDLSKRDDQEKKQRKKRKGLYGPKHKGNQPAWSWKETTGQHHACWLSRTLSHHIPYRAKAEKHKTIL